MPRFRRVWCALLAGAMLPFACVCGAGAFVARHVYVAPNAVGGQSQPKMMRFAVHDGVPENKPEHLYDSEWHGPITVGVDGFLYAETSNRRFFHVIGVFGPRSDHPLHSIIIRNSYPFLEESALGVDTQGYLFVFEYETTGSERTDLDDCVDAGGTLVYSPNNYGFARPRRCYFTPGGQDTIAIDATEHLYTTEGFDGGYCGYGSQGEVIDVYTHPRKHPVQIQQMMGDSFRCIESLAVDANGDLYVLNKGKYPKDYSYVATYPASGNGDVVPLRTLEAPHRQTWVGTLTVDDRYLYITAGNTLFIYPKTAHGRANPKATVTLPPPYGGFYDVAVGP